MPLLSGSRSSLRVVVRLESVFVPLHALVTRASFFRRRCARRRVVHKTDPWGFVSSRLLSVLSLALSFCMRPPGPLLLCLVGPCLFLPPRMLRPPPSIRL